MRVTARLAGACVAGIVRSRRRRRRSRRRRYGPIGVDSSGWWSKSSTADAMASTAKLGEVSIGGDGRWLYGLGFGIGENWTAMEKKTSRARPELLYGAWARASSHRRGRRRRQREEKSSTASCCPPAHGEDEDDAPPLLFWRKGILGWRWAVLVGCCWVATGLVAGLQPGLRCR
jgi:hypothetical protein